LALNSQIHTKMVEIPKQPEDPRPCHSRPLLLPSARMPSIFHQGSEQANQVAQRTAENCFSAPGPASRGTAPAHSLPAAHRASPESGKAKAEILGSMPTDRREAHLC
jgi:hypothetical protein